MRSPVGKFPRSIFALTNMQKKILPAILLLLSIGLVFFVFAKKGQVGNNTPSERAPAEVVEEESAVRSPSVLHVAVDANARMGEMPHVFRLGALGMKWPGAPVAERFFKDQLPGELFVGWNLDFASRLDPGGLADLPSLDAFLKTLPSSNMALWAKEWHRAGGEVTVSAFCTPKWLRTVTGDLDTNCHNPPKDLTGWNTYIRGIASYFQDTAKIPVGYHTWDESDSHFFRGPLKEYLDLHKATVEAVRSVDPQAKIFGPNSAAFLGENFEEDLEKPLVYHFLEYSRKHDLPLDGLTWHIFSLVPETYDDDVAQARAWAKEFGYTDLAFDINSWGPLDANYNTEEVAAFVVPVLDEMQRAGIERHVFFNLFEHWQGGEVTPDSEFTEGGLGIFTKDFVIKPVYNSFRALALLSGKTDGKIADRVGVSMPDDGYVTVVASRGANHTRVLIANFVPSGKFLEASLLSVARACLVADGYSMEELRAMAGEMRKGEVLSPKAKTDLEKCSPHVDAKKSEMLNFSKTPREVSVAVSNLSTGKHTVKKYLIDAEHSNSCRYNKSTEPRPTDTACGVGGAIDKEVAKVKQEAIKKQDRDLFFRAVDAINNKKEVALETVSEESVNIADTTYTETVFLQPNAVLLIEIGA
ncbi:MAG: hypothetical protein A3H76_03225 [Candidatus Lloydbacteria bacterium RIFCSPLOWO2_02_FULL_54_12]|nr:MAG: hypothetical protein A3H76_03225 [Candidatus Lloydbacteria bacterium RIFCSPLOWO2_02_FULL_54_12]